MLRATALACVLLASALIARPQVPASTTDSDATAPAASPARNRPAKQIPPRGITIPDPVRMELSAEVSSLGAEIEALRRAGNLSVGRFGGGDLLPDVEVFHKAVDWALRFDGFHDAKEVATARELLSEGRSRAAALREGRAPWTRATGPVVRAFRSGIDGSVQPVGVVVPAAWKGEADEVPRATWIWNHGRGDTLSELAFISQRMKGAGEFSPTNTIVIHPYGRYCNATKFAGEQDVFEALAAARRAYPVDPRRLVNAGFSMGGASAWHLGVHHPDLWAASHPGAGFAETSEYAGVFAPGKVAPPWWEQVLWRWYDATVAAANLGRHPVLAYHGSEDKQGQATAIMKRFAEREGVSLEHFVGPGVGHKYEAKTKQRIGSRLDEILAAGQSGTSGATNTLRFVTYSLIYPRCDWITIAGMDRQWERAEVNGRIRPATAGAASRLDVESRGVSRLILDPAHAAGQGPAASGSRHVVILDGQDLGLLPARPATYEKRMGRWVPEAGTGPAEGSRKVPGMCGPIDHAFLSSFLFVRPTSRARHPEIGEWTDRELGEAVRQWRGLFRGEVPVRADTAVTEQDIASNHLVLWGDPESNAVLRQIAGRLPVRWTAEGIEFGGRAYGRRHVPILVFPNPLNPKKYVVLNSGFTFGRGSAGGTNSQQTPKLPDWAIVDVSVPGDDQFPGRIVDAGFFDESWIYTVARPH